MVIYYNINENVRMVWINQESGDPPTRFKPFHPNPPLLSSGHPSLNKVALF